MKNISLLLLGLSLAAMSILPHHAAARGTAKERRAEAAQATARTVDSLLSAKSYIFVPDRVVTSYPGQTYITLTSYYEFMVTADSLSSRLPYYGYAYNTIPQPTISPLNFESTKFSYEQQGQASGRQKAVITIKARANGLPSTFTVTLEIFDNANAALNIQGNGTQRLLFTGTIQALEPDSTPKIP